MRTYKIIPLPTIKLQVDMGMFTYRMNYGTKIWVPALMWYIDGADQQILVDSGGDVNFAKNFRNLDAKEVMSFGEALKTVDLRSDDVEIIIQTHLHWDHCFNTAECKNAKVLVQAEEINFAFSPHPVVANLYHEPLFSNLEFIPITGEYEVAQGIKIIPAPGHTPGIQAVSVGTEKGKAIISGFCSIKENFSPPDEKMRDILPVLPTGTHTDMFASFDSALKIKRMADILIPQHDPSYINVKRLP